MLPTTESETTEFKESLSDVCLSRSGKSVAAFANTKWWSIYFGIFDDWKISKQVFGDKDLQKVATYYANKIDPKIYTNIKIINNDDWDIIEVSIWESKRKIHTFDGVWYSRVWTTNQPRDKPEYTNRLIESSWHISTWSGAICLWATIDDLDENALNYFIEKIVKEKIPSEYDTLKKTNIYDALYSFWLIEKEQDNIHITNDCMILFGKERSVDKLLWEYAIKYKYTEAKDFTHTFESGVAPDRAIWYAPFITKFEEIEQKIESHNHYLAESTLFRSKEVKQYDPITIRELLMNSIMHSDRSQEKFIEIEQTINSLRFENTGEYEFWSLADLAQNPNQFKNYRNKTLSKFLFSLWFVEREASGIIAKIVRKQQKKWLPLPKYSKINGWTRVDIIATVTNPDFAKLVMQVEDMDLIELIALDHIVDGHNSIWKDIDKSLAHIMKTKWYIDISWTRYQIATFSKTFSIKIKKKGLYTKWKWLPRNKAFMLIDEHIDTFWSIKKSEARDMFSQFSDDQIANLLSRSLRYKLHKEWHSSQRYYTKKR
jgi:predicted HTH transcriptional regulator